MSDVSTRLAMVGIGQRTLPPMMDGQEFDILEDVSQTSVKQAMHRGASFCLGSANNTHIASIK